MKEKINKIYENRQNFVVIGLTGKTGSGCSTVAEILEKGYENYNPVDFNQKELQNRKANIINKFTMRQYYSLFYSNRPKKHL